MQAHQRQLLARRARTEQIYEFRCSHLTQGSVFPGIITAKSPDIFVCSRAQVARRVRRTTMC